MSIGEDRLQGHDRDTKVALEGPSRVSVRHSTNFSSKQYSGKSLNVAPGGSLDSRPIQPHAALACVTVQSSPPMRRGCAARRARGVERQSLAGLCTFRI